MLNEDIIKLDRGRVNARILRKEAKADFRRIESASRKIPTKLCSPELKRLYFRCFATLQLNVHYISVIARTKLPHEVVEQVEGALKAQLEKLTAEVDEAIRGAELLCQSNGIMSLATYDTTPLAMDVPVISPLSRRYLELMMKVDQLMPMLETLAIDEVIAMRELDLRKALFKKLVRRVAGAARNFASGLRKRQSGPAEPNGVPQDSVEPQEVAMVPNTDQPAPPVAPASEA